MDVSTFFLSWQRLWLWVVVPLFLRLLVTFGFAYLYRPAEEELSRTRVYVDAIAQMEKAERKQQAMIQPFILEGSVPFQEYFLTEVSCQSKRADVRVDTECSTKDINGTGLKRAQFAVSGNAATLHEMSLFLDNMMIEPQVVLTGLSVHRNKSADGVQDGGVKFEVVFERVDVKANLGKVSS